VALSLPSPDVRRGDAVDANGVQQNFEVLARAASALTPSGVVQIPVGLVLPYGGTNAPVGYLLCDGAYKNRTQFANLFGVLGTTYGTNAANNFRLPNLTGATIGGVSLQFVIKV
jgi:hypothetical protein